MVGGTMHTNEEAAACPCVTPGVQASNRETEKKGSGK
jgi:hypothetical protein